ncbi:hypothetical protein Vi05172_g11617 [Venturia inaequalis]|nr:hypothetical protein Vi05172_g11617 [Venturia inaequalis]
MNPDVLEEAKQEDQMQLISTLSQKVIDESEEKFGDASRVLSRFYRIPKASKQLRRTNACYNLSPLTSKVPSTCYQEQTSDVSETFAYFFKTMYQSTNIFRQRATSQPSVFAV